MTKLLITTLLLATLNCNARLNETLEECTARYGLPIQTPSGKNKFYMFSKNEVTVACEFKNNICFNIGYQRLKSDFSQDEITLEQYKFTATDIANFTSIYSKEWIENHYTMRESKDGKISFKLSQAGKYISFSLNNITEKKNIEDIDMEGF